MSSQDSSSTYLEQMSSLFNTVSSYMRLPVMISSVLSNLQLLLAHEIVLIMNQGIAALLSSALYIKQKCVLRLFCTHPFRTNVMAERSFTPPTSLQTPAHISIRPPNTASRISKT